MIKGKTTMIQKDLQKGITPNNYRPITYLTIMWEILTAQISEKINYLLINCRLFHVKQKGYCKGTRETEELLYVDQHILNKSKKTWKNVAMAMIDNKKAYNMVPQRWLINCRKMYQLFNEVIKFIKKNMENCCGIDRRRKKISSDKNSERYIPGRCAITIIICCSNDATQSHILWNAQVDINFINHKKRSIILRTWSMLNCLLKTKKIRNPNTGSENIEWGHRDGIWHRICTILIMGSGKWHMTEGIKQPNQKKIRMHRKKEIYKYLGILEADNFKQVEMKTEYLRRMRKRLETKLHGRNLIKGIIT